VGPRTGGLLSGSGKPEQAGSIDIPDLNSLTLWSEATERDRRRFVDAVGLFHLLEAAPADHRKHFLAEVRKPVPPPPPRPSFDFGDLGIPNFLLRRELTS
jgi:hypothetical protein